MKKYIPVISCALLIILTIASCSKSPATSSANWSFEGQSFGSTTVTTTANSITGTATNGNSFTFYFDNWPTASGTYFIPSPSHIGPNEMSISLSLNGKSYFSTGVSGNTTVNVTVNNSKISVSVPGPATLLHSAADSSMSFSATIAQ